MQPANPTGGAMPETSTQRRILGAAFAAFTEDGYGGTSTLDIARRAKVSKRDLYANFGSKHAVLVACIKNRVARMRLTPALPIPRDPQMLAATLTGFAANLVRETSDPAVIAMFRLAVAEAARSPEIGQALDSTGRAATREALARLLAGAQAAGLIGPGEPDALATQYIALVWEGLMVGLLLGVAATPEPEEAERRAAGATAAFLRLHARAGAASAD